MKSREFALIVAGGKGLRFGSSIPKQFLELRGKPVLFHTLDAFYQYSPDIQIVLVLPAQQIATWNELVEKHNYSRQVTIQEGGDTRFQSVRNGLQLVPEQGYVAIHDGVRPLISTDVIAESFSVARTHGAAIASVLLKDSLRQIHSPTSTRAVDRTRYLLVQTPQTFEISRIRKAYEIPEDDTLTDDASVAERAGITVVCFQGSYSNIKITGPEDLAVAECLLAGTEA